MRTMTRGHLEKRNADEIGAEIKRLRKESGMTQERFAEILGIDSTLVSKIERGRKSNLTIDLLQDIAEVFGVTVNDICYFQSSVESEETGIEKGEEVAFKAFEIMKELPEAQQEFLLKMLKGAVG